MSLPTLLSDVVVHSGGLIEMMFAILFVAVIALVIDHLLAPDPFVHKIIMVIALVFCLVLLWAGLTGHLIVFSN